MSLSSRVYAEDGADITNQISRIDVGLYQKFSPHRAKDTLRTESPSIFLDKSGRVASSFPTFLGKIEATLLAG